MNSAVNNIDDIGETVWLGPDNIIYSVSDERQTPERVTAGLELMNKYITQLKDRNLPVLILIDLTHVNAIQSATRRGAQMLQFSKIDRIACVTKSRTMAAFSRFMGITIGYKLVAAFPTKEKAVAYLKNFPKK